MPSRKQPVRLITIRSGPGTPRTEDGSSTRNGRATASSSPATIATARRSLRRSDEYVTDSARETKSGALAHPLRASNDVGSGLTSVDSIGLFMPASPGSLKPHRDQRATIARLDGELRGVRTHQRQPESRARRRALRPLE